MAVYTDVSLGDLARWLASRNPGLGEVTRFTPIAQGIENTNYFVDTTSGRFVLTLLERTAADAIEFPIALMKYLATHGIRCPEPQAGVDGSLWAPLNGKPATLATRLPGRQLDRPGPAACEALGRLLARMHLAAAGFGGPVPPNPRGLAWWPGAVVDVLPSLAPETARMLGDEVSAQRAFAASADGRALPRSAVHADLFRDNALFDEDGEPGVIDFYFACEESWLFDLAVTVNDWCTASPSAGSAEPGTIEADFEPASPSAGAGDDAGAGFDSGAVMGAGSGADLGADMGAGTGGSDGARQAIGATPSPLDPDRFAALLRGYCAVRPLHDIERAAFPTLLRAAALRFWLSRLHDLARPRSATLLEAKDPKPFEHLLRQLRDDVAIRNFLSDLDLPGG